MRCFAFRGIGGAIDGATPFDSSILPGWVSLYSGVESISLKPSGEDRMHVVIARSCVILMLILHTSCALLEIDYNPLEKPLMLQ